MKIPQLSAMVLGLAFVTASSCGPTTRQCTPSSCATGCCDSTGTCQPGTASNACGGLGASCQLCNIGQACNLGFCSGATGGGTGNGGGTGGGTTGGGTGGGATGGGTGGGVTGGGTGGGATGGGTGGGVTGGGTGGGSTGGGGGSTCDGCFFNGMCIARANSNNNTLCGQGGVTCATCTGLQICMNYVCTGGTGGGGGATGGGTGGGVTGGGTGGGVTGGGIGGGTGGGGVSSGGETCAAPIAITPGQTLNNNLTSYLNDYDGSGSGCAGSAAPDIAYSLVVPAGQLLRLTVTPDTTFDPAISVSTSAAACNVTCTNAVDVGYAGDAEILVYRNTTGASQTLFIVIDAYDTASIGTFSLLATLTTPPADDTCAAPLALATNGVPRTGQTIDVYSDDYSTGTGCLGFDGPDRTYVVSVPSGQRLSVTATPAAGADVALSLVDGAANCGVACLATADAITEGGVETLTFINTGATRSFLVVADFPATSVGTFDIAATVGSPALDEVCGGATLLSAGVQLSSQTTIGYTNDYASSATSLGCSGNATTGPDRVYQFTVPNQQRGIVTVTPTSSGYNPSMNIVEGPAAVCAAMPRVCAAGINVRGADQPEVASVSNVSGAAKTYFAIVDSTAGGNFNIGYTAGAPAANDTCSTTAVTLTTGTRNDNLTGFNSDYSSGVNCFPAAGPDRVYRVPLTANQKFTFTVTPNALDGGLDPVINLIPGPAANCEAVPRVCRPGVDATVASQAETGAFTNNTGATMDLFFVIGDYELASTSRDFTIVSSIAVAPQGESCQLPQPLSAGTLSGQSTAGLSTDVVIAANSTGCAPTRGSPDRVYSVLVPAGQTLNVTATPTTTEDLILNLIDGAPATCANVTTCAASADVGFDSEAEVIGFTNTTGSARVVFLQVTSYGPSANFSLTTTIQ